MSKIKHVFTGVFIPANIWLSNELTPAEKMILGEVEALSKETGWCYAGRKHFTEWLHCTPPNITYYIAHLEELGFLKVERSPGERSRMQIISERFYEKGSKEGLRVGSKEGLPGSKEGLRVGSKEGLPGSKEGLPASYIKEKENYKIQNKENADANAPLLPPYKKIDEIETETFSFDDEKNPPYPPFPAAPLSPNGAAVRISLRDPDIPGVEIVDEVKPEPQTPPEKTGRGRAKNGKCENTAWTKRAAELFDLVSSENGCPDFNWKINAGRDFKALKDIRAAMAADIEKKQSRAATEEEYERGFEYLFRTGYKYLAEIANGRGGVVQFSPMTIKNCYNQILNYGRNAGKSPAGTKPGEHLNAAQRQHLNLANYIAQRRIAAMERAANGGAVD